ncbi:MAG: hypothetical protein NZP74_08050 [Anaerolineales bacterium]|nr:hypothetical protein [Anaerolineales bacterium]
MAFEVRDYYDFMRLLHQHPEWQEELRRLVLTREILELPEIVRELAQAQKRTEQRVEELAEAQKRTEQRVEELAEAQKRSEERLTRLEQVVAELAEAQKRSEERLTRLEQVVAELAEAQKRTEEELRVLTRRVDKLTGEVGNLRGDMLEMQYRQRAFGFFGRMVSRVRVVDLQEIWSELEQRLTEQEMEALLSLDILLSGRLKAGWAAQAGVSDIWLAVEVSGVVDVEDVRRAWKRAGLFHRAGFWTLPVAAGNQWTEGAREEAAEKGVVLQRDGQLEFVEQALEAAKKAAQAG